MLSGNTFASGEFYCDVIANEHKWCLVFDCTELLRFSHVVHCLVSSFTCTFSFQKMLIENFHKLNRPQRHQNRTSTSTQKCSCYANYTFCFDLSMSNMTATEYNQSCTNLNTLYIFHCQNEIHLTIIWRQGNFACFHAAMCRDVY